MPAAFICIDFIRKVVAIVSLLALPAAAQQTNNAVAVTPASGSTQPVASEQNTNQQPGAPTPNAPEPKKLPQPTRVDYSKPTPLFPNPFARYLPPTLPPPAFPHPPPL